MTVVYYLTTAFDDYRPRYVGQTEDPLVRYRKHTLYDIKSKKRRKIRDYIISRQKSGHEILMYIINDRAVRNYDEIFYIKNYRERGFPLLNQTSGGDDGIAENTNRRGYKWSAEARRRKSESMKGKPRHPNLDAAIKEALKKPETRKKMRESRLKYSMTEETKKKLSIALMGHPVSDKTRESASRRFKGVPLSPEIRKKISMANKGNTKGWETRRRKERENV